MRGKFHCYTRSTFMATSSLSARPNGPMAGQARLTPCQMKALDVLQREGNVFLTGAAGTGKSFLLDQYLAGKPTDAFPVVASTGAAAVIVGGRTFHSFFGLGILEGGAEMAVARALRNRRVINRLRRACCVVIDEVSMLAGATLQAAETVARRAREIAAPWGGLRIIAVGDFAQLPPITADQRNKDWAFRHDVWQESDFEPALLSTVMRTQDTAFLEILNFVREGIVNDRVSDFLQQRTMPSSDTADGTRLYPHRAQAEQYNLRRLASLPQKLHEFPTQYIGVEKYLDAARRAVPIPDTLQIKENALIMMRKNDPSGELRYVNGSLGHIRGIGDETLFITLLSGDDIEVGKEKFSSLDGDGNEVMAAWNFPVTLAWATTIHKAQGASLDRLIVDLHQLWEPGQAYVALSRVRSGDGLMVERWHPASIRAEPLVTAFYDGLADRAKKYKPRPLFAPSQSVQTIDQDDRASSSTRRAHTSKQRIEMTRVFLGEGKDLAFIADTCDVTPATVLTYIEKLIARGAAPHLGYLIVEFPDIDRIRSLFREHGLERMKPVFDALGGAVSYDDLRLVRLVLAAGER